MTNQITIVSTLDARGHIYNYDEREIKNEPMLLQASKTFAMTHGGPITRRFLEHLPAGKAIIDSRVHMLMPGMYPCIPGWHHDDVPRTRKDGQPNYFSPEYKSRHFMAIFGNCSKTEFAEGTHVITVPPVGTKIYKVLSPQVEELCNKEVLYRTSVESGHLYEFNWQSWHRGTAATKRGFRFFIRASFNTDLKPKDEVRMNANVYLPVLDEGW